MRTALGELPSKLFLETSNGVPIISRSVLAMLAAVEGGIVVAVTPPGLEAEFKNILSKSCSAPQMERLRFIAGGASRQESVCNGLEAIAAECGDELPELVMIHDGARPFIEAADIAQLLEHSNRMKPGKVAMTLATPSTNTVKRAHIRETGEVVVVETPPRNELWEIQTPQLFSFDTILNAHRKLKNSGEEFTDDCQLIEAMGGEVRLVAGSRSNIKVTAPGDVVAGG